MSDEPAYTPRAEYQCDGSTTHYMGCKCHEARRSAELARATEREQELTHQVRILTDYKAAALAELLRFREALEKISKFQVSRFSDGGYLQFIGVGAQHIAKDALEARHVDHSNCGVGPCAVLSRQETAPSYVTTGQWLDNKTAPNQVTFWSCLCGCLTNYDETCRRCGFEKPVATAKEAVKEPL